MLLPNSVFGEVTAPSACGVERCGAGRCVGAAVWAVRPEPAAVATRTAARIQCFILFMLRVLRDRLTITRGLLASVVTQAAVVQHLDPSQTACAPYTHATHKSCA